jgi:hypothetical protein
MSTGHKIHDKDAVLICSAIAKYSMEYWDYNNRASWWQIVLVNTIGGAGGIQYNSTFTW